MYISFATHANKYMAFFYILLWIFLGNYVLLNLFLAILLDGFSLGNENYQDQLIDDFTYFY